LIKTAFALGLGNTEPYPCIASDECAAS
jgi:hypothetical protein